jgi:hypothetical protein
MSSVAVISDIAKKDQLLATVKPERLKGFAVIPADVGSIFTVILGVDSKVGFGRILTMKEFLTVPVEKILLWYPLTDFDVNIEKL